jgi:hypothetical protein
MPPSIKSVQAVLLAILCAGGVACHRQTVQAAAPSTPPPSDEAVKTAPTATPGTDTGATSTPASPVLKGTAPDTSPAVTPAPKPVEPKPRPVTPTPAATPEPPTPKPAPPQITQRISPAQEAELKSQTQKSIAEAETNLRAASGRQLNDVQRDMVDKIQNFLVQARDASELPDWNRAHILADKARLLSVELVNSL